MARPAALHVVKSGPLVLDDEQRPRLVGSVEELNDEMLLCRDSSLRHKWDFAGDEDFKYRRGRLVEITRVFRCDRGCGCLKYEVLEVPGFTRITRPSIRYPRGYLVIGGGVANEDLRAEYYARRGVMTKK